jgi:hypothetical protein
MNYWTRVANVGTCCSALPAARALCDTRYVRPCSPLAAMQAVVAGTTCTRYAATEREEWIHRLVGGGR